MRDGGAGDVAQGDDDGGGGGGGEGGCGAGDGRGVANPPLLLVWASSQLNLKSRRRSFSGHFLRPLPRIWRCGPVYRPAPDRVFFLDSTFRVLPRLST